MPKTILYIDSSVRTEGSASRYLSQYLVAHLVSNNPTAKVTYRDTNQAPRFIDSAWVDASFTSNESRNIEMKEVLKYSDTMISELVSASHIVIGAPLYNFGIPTTLKSWIDYIARPGLSFLVKNDKFEGLLKNKKVYLVIVSGSTDIDGPMDFATPYLKQMLGFLGITEIVSFSVSNLDIENRESILKETIHTIDQTSF